MFFLSQTIVNGSYTPTADSLRQTDTLITTLHSDLKYNKLPDSLQTDTNLRKAYKTDTLLVTDTDTTEQVAQQRKIPSPQRATILSAVLPGLGQAYNHRYWKIPIIYAAGAGLYYRYYTMNKNYQEAKKNYFEAVSGNPEYAPDKNLYEAEKDEYLNKRTYAIIFIGILYLANVVDAMTDAYFLQYDISDDLTIGFQPTLIPESSIVKNTYSYGVQISIYF